MKHLATIMQPREKPDAKELLSLLQLAVTDSSDFLSRMELNARTKGCHWDGQSSDGRKHEDDLGEPAVPWEGASDIKHPLAEMLVAEAVLICRAAMEGRRMQAEPVDTTDDPETAASQGPMLKWLMDGPMRTEIRDETDFLLDWQFTFGHAVMAVDWKQKRQLKQETLTNDMLLQLAGDAALQQEGLPAAADMEQLAQSGQLPPEMAQQTAVILQTTEENLVAALLDPRMTDRLVTLVDRLLNPDGEQPLSIPMGEIRRVVKALQAGEPGIYYRPWLKEDRPQWRALLPFVDVFYPRNTTKLEDAPWIARVHMLSETRLRDRAVLEGWDEDWVEEALLKPGNQYSELLSGKNRGWVLAGSAVQRGVSKDQDSAASREYQIIELFQTSSAQMGVPCIYRTVLHPGVTDSYAIHEPLVEQQGCYHFIEFRRARKDSRYLTDSEGLPELVLTHQAAMKAQLDARTNRTDLELMPPAMVPMNRAGGQFQLGPMAQIPTRRSGTIEWMKPPQMSIDSIAITEALQKLIDQRFGRFSEHVPDPLAQLHLGKTTTDFLTDVARTCQLTFEACTAYYGDDVWQRITGGPKPEPDPYQQDLMITFDARTLNMEWLSELMTLYTQFVVPNDSEGVIDRAAMVEYMFRSLAPQVAERVIKPKDSAAQGEMEDELTQLAIIMSGAEPPQKQGQNYALRLQVLQKFMTTSMEIQSKLQQNPQVMEVMKARVEFFQNQLQQSANAIIGRTMQQPVMGGGV